MGRTQPSRGQPPASQRKDARAKYAKQTVNKTIPALLASNPRARRGVENAELVVSPSANASALGDLTSRSSRTKITRDLNGEDHERNDVQTTRTIPFNLSVMVTDTLTAAHRLHMSSSKSSQKSTNKKLLNVAILNMASPLRPGGGLINGSVSQEELLCLHTTLYPSLKDEWYRLPELGVIWTGDVLVFREPKSGGKEEATELSKADRWSVDVVSAGALRFPDVDSPEDEGDNDQVESDDDDGIVDEEAPVSMAASEATYSNSADRELVMAKMRAVLRVLEAKGVTRIVLGAWGCGAYKNPVGEIAKAWRKVLLGEQSQNKARRKGGSKAGNKTPETWNGFEEVVFAITEKRMADQFAKAFGPELSIEEEEVKDDGERDEEHGEEKAGVDCELAVKIAELEGQMQRVLNPGLKERLESVLQGLRKEKESTDTAGNNHDSDDDSNDS